MSIIAQTDTIENVVIPFLGSQSVLLHATIIRNDYGIANLSLSTAFLQLKSDDVVDVVEMLGFYLYNDSEGFCCGLDPMEYGIISRINVSLSQWSRIIYFKDEVLEIELSNHLFDIERSPSMIERMTHLGLVLVGLKFKIETSEANKGSSKSQKQKKGKVYLIGNRQANILKIGYSTDLKQRLATLQTSSPFELTILASLTGTMETEQSMLKNFKSLRLKGEWFKWDESILKAFKVK